MNDIDPRRAELVDQLKRRGIHDKGVLNAFGSIPREAFVSAEYVKHAYENRPLPIGFGQTISQPFVVAIMIQYLRLSGSETVLEIGTGSGYAAAILSQLCQRVITMERRSELAKAAKERLQLLGYRNVTVIDGDGTLGWAKFAPYDAIIVSAGGPQIPSALKQQLSIEGRLIIPVGARQRGQQLTLVQRLGATLYKQKDLGGVRFVPLIGEDGWYS